jgi:hypothetical protein
MIRAHNLMRKTNMYTNDYRIDMNCIKEHKKIFNLRKSIEVAFDMVYRNE